MKQVVINGGKAYGTLLTPYWAEKFLSRKGYKVYIYIQDWDDNENEIFTLINDYENLKDNYSNSIEIYNVLYLNKFVGLTLDSDDWDRLVDYNMYIDLIEILKNREDKDLIEIAKEINNENIIKIIEIPNDIKYKICDSDCGFDEYILEDIKVRKWF